VKQVSNPCSVIRLAKSLLAAVCLLVGFAAHTAAPLTPLTFNVWLDERKMGQHVYTFEASSSAANDLIVTSEADFKVKVMFVTVFNYQHNAVETWRGNCLAALESETTTNGKQEVIELRYPETDCAGTYVYWDKARLKRSVLTNAQNGQTEPASWTDLGSVPLPTIGKRKKVKGHSTDVQGVTLTTPSASFNLYYNDAEELLMMQTENDSRTITYLHHSLSAR